METREMKLGSLYTFSAYFLWGFLTIYWKQVEHVAAMEVLAHRIVWALVFMVLLLFVMRQFTAFTKVFEDILRQPKKLLTISIASVLITINWFLFIWAVANDYVLQASLGYYINPLFSILLGIIVLREKVTSKQTAAFILAAIGVLFLTFRSGVFPWISIALALSFATYGLLKKQMNLSAVHSLTIETMIISPLAIVYLWMMPDRTFQFSSVLQTDHLLLIGGGIATAIPLLLFSSGARVIPLSMVGILQFVTPTIMLLLGVFVYQEPFSTDNLVAFLFIWTALLLYLSTVYYRPAKRKLKS